MNILNTTHNLFASEDISIVKLWGTSTLATDGPTPACVMLVAPQYLGRNPWFLLKSALLNFVRSLDLVSPEREVSTFCLVFNDKDNTVNFGVDRTIYQLRFLSPVPYWCFKSLSKGVEYADWQRGCNLDEASLLGAISGFTIPGELPVGMRGPELRSLDTGAGRQMSTSASNVVTVPVHSTLNTVQPHSGALPDLSYPNRSFMTKGDTEVTTEVKIKVEEVEPTLSVDSPMESLATPADLSLTTPEIALGSFSRFWFPSPGTFIDSLNHLGQPLFCSPLQSLGHRITSGIPTEITPQVSLTTTTMTIPSMRTPLPSFPGRLMDFLTRFDLPSILQPQAADDQELTRGRKRRGQWDETRSQKRSRF